MPRGPIIDTHLHLWDPGALRYPWLEGNPVLNRAYGLADYADATRGLDIEAMVFLQCECLPEQAHEEADHVASLAENEPRIRGMVAWAPLEKGRAAEADILRLKRHAILRGVRRIIQFEPDLDFCLRPDFIEGVRMLAVHGLSFDICIDHRHMANLIRFVEQAPDTPMILDHIGKPAIAAGVMEPWAAQMRALARFPNLSCKISGVATEADHAAWQEDDLKRYIAVAIDAFGFERIMFGGDWPVAVQAISFARWVGLLDEVLSGTGEADKARFWSGNAKAFYRLEEAA